MKNLLLIVLICMLQPLLAAPTNENIQFPHVNNHWMRAAPPNAKMLAAYLTAENNTSEHLKLTGVYAPDFGMAEIHKTIEVDGLLKMREQKEIDLPVNANVVMQPGGLHIMLMMPKKRFKIGEEVRICLVYEKESGDEIVQHLDFPVQRQ